MNRRASLGSLAAASAMLALPGAAQAAPGDADIFAAIERLRALQRVKEVAAGALTVQEERLPCRSQFLALLARRDDPAIFGTEKPAGEPLDFQDIEAACNILRVFQMSGVGEVNALFGLAFMRVTEIGQSSSEFRRLWATAKAHPVHVSVEEAFSAAASAVFDAATEVLELRPATIAGLLALVSTLLDANFFDPDMQGEALARLLIEASALHAEA